MIALSTTVLNKMIDSIEALVNLAYLVELDRQNPNRVLQHIRKTDLVLKHMTELIIQNSKDRDTRAADLALHR